MFDAIASMLGSFDLTSFLPDIQTSMGQIELFARLTVMAGPLILLGLGLWYLLSPPKDNRSYVGFRTVRRAKTVQAWRYAQNMAGKIWGGLGVVLTLVMALICNAFRWMNGLTMATTAIVCIAVELVLLVTSNLYINKQVAKRFDKEGYPIAKK